MPTCERDWRHVLILEAARRATRPPQLQLGELLCRVDPALTMDIEDIANAVVFDAVNVALHMSEALRRLPATPETQEDGEAHLGRIAAAAFAEGSECEREWRRLVTDVELAGTLRRQMGEFTGRLHEARQQAVGAGTRSRWSPRHARRSRASGSWEPAVSYRGGVAAGFPFLAAEPDGWQGACRPTNEKMIGGEIRWARIRLPTGHAV